MGIMQRALLVFTLAWPCAAVHAQDAPDCTIKIIVSGPAGGTPDLIARLGADKLKSSLNRNTFVENRAGGRAAVSSITAVRSAPPDGCTLLAANASIFSIGPHLFKVAPYDPVQDFSPIAVLATSPNVLVINPAVPAKNLKEFVALLKSQPNKFNFGSGGVGTPMHIYGALISSRFDVVFTHVPYRGSAPVVTDLLSGQVQFVFEQIPTFLSHVQAGTLRALAVASASRSPLLPDVPTFREEGIEGADAVSWFGVVAPRGTPDGIINLYAKALRDGMRDPQVAAKLSAVGAEISGMTPAEMIPYMENQKAKWAPLVAASGVQVE